MPDIHNIIKKLTLEQSKELLLSLAGDVYAMLDEDEKREFILKMADKTGKDKIGSMVQL